MTEIPLKILGSVENFIFFNIHPFEHRIRVRPVRQVNAITESALGVLRNSGFSDATLLEY